jgi:hypothetical protein
MHPHCSVGLSTIHSYIVYSPFAHTWAIRGILRLIAHFDDDELETMDDMAHL